MKNFKIIAVLNVRDIARTDRLANHYESLRYMNTYQLEAYTSLEDAIESMDEEFLTCINEIVFKRFTILKTRIYINLMEDDDIEASVEYTGDGNIIYCSHYSITLINLVS